MATYNVYGAGFGGSFTNKVGEVRSSGNVYGAGFGGSFTNKVGEASSNGNVYAVGNGEGITRKVGEVNGTSNIYLIGGAGLLLLINKSKPSNKSHIMDGAPPDRNIHLFSQKWWFLRQPIPKYRGNFYIKSVLRFSTAHLKSCLSALFVSR
jgi:hypothetical protein